MHGTGGDGAAWGEEGEFGSDQGLPVLGYEHPPQGAHSVLGPDGEQPLQQRHLA